MYNLNVDLLYDNVYTKIGLNKSIRSQDIKKTDFLCKSRSVTLLQICKKMTIYYPNRRFCQ